MATNTTNYNLVKPSENEYYDININNSNLDIIDTEIKKIDTKVSNISTSAEGTTFNNSTNGMKSTNVQSAIEEVYAELRGQVERGIQLTNEMLGML